MSDCRNGGRLAYLPPEGPTLKRLAELNGGPPWEYEIPAPDFLPPEGIDLIGAVVMGGVRFARDVDGSATCGDAVQSHVSPSGGA